MEENIQNLHDPEVDRKRPFSVTLLAVLVLSITIVHMVRFINTLTLWNFLTELPGKSPFYLALTGLFGSIAGALTSWGLWSGKSWARTATGILTVVYLGLLWIEQVFAVRAGNKFENWPFWVGMTFVILIFVFWTLLHASSKAYFGEMHEPSEKD
jgi:magnesium-transporting ATPase (P-type)